MGLRTTPAAPSEAYLGLLTSAEGHKVFGFVTNTRARLLLAVDDAALREEDVKSAFHKVHAAYVATASNPFYTAGAQLTSPKFTAAMRAIAAAPLAAPPASAASTAP